MKESPGRPGFTLIELLVGVLCLTVLLGPVFRVFRQGTRSTLKEMLAIETTMEARRILRLVESDLQAACFPIDGNRTQVNWKTLLSIKGSFPDVSFGFLRFPGHGEIEECLSHLGVGTAERFASRVGYRVEPHPDRPALRRLVRTEVFHPKHPLARRYPLGKIESVLTDRLNLFDIKPELIESGGHSLLTFRVTLQLIDSSRPEEITKTMPGGAGIQRPVDGTIADFFEVVNSEFYRLMIDRRNFNPNWQTRISGP